MYEWMSDWLEFIIILIIITFAQFYSENSHERANESHMV